MKENKPLLLFAGPVTSRSGYGDHSRDIVRSIIKSNKYELHILPISWGTTPLNALKDGKDDDIINLLMHGNKLSRQPDIFIHLTVPNEFQTLGKYNIGITAGIETTICSPEWIQGLNRMDKIIVPSNFAKEVFENSAFNKRNNNQDVGVLKCEKPIEVIFEGVDTNIYKKITSLHTQVRYTLNSISEDFLFLFVGHWLNGDLGHDRKDVGMLIKTFLSTFKNKKIKPALLLKTGNNFSYREYDHIYNKINNIKQSFNNSDDLPNIYLLHGELTNEEMNELYNHNKVKANITFTKGEGFGRPLLEASMSEKPIIASRWSGHLDFLNPNYTFLLPGNLQKVHKSSVWDKVIIPESSWFYVNYTYASSVMLDIFTNYSKYSGRSKALAEENTHKFNIEEMDKLILQLLDSIPVEKQPEIVIPKLPTLKLTEDK